jgi:phage FluMu protein gp41
MAKLTRIEVNCATGEQKEVELTAKEIAELDQLRANMEARKIAEEAEAQAKAETKALALAKLAKLGLTEEEAEAIVK